MNKKHKYKTDEDVLIEYALTLLTLDFSDPDLDKKYMYELRGEILDRMASTEERSLENEPHTYIPGDSYHPMHTYALCLVCGLPDKAPVHK